MQREVTLLNKSKKFATHAPEGGRKKKTELVQQNT